MEATNSFSYLRGADYEPEFLSEEQVPQSQEVEPSSPVNKGQLVKEPAPSAEDDPVSFLAARVSSWFVRSQHNFHDVSRPTTKLSRPEVQRLCFQRFNREYPQIELTDDVLREIFHRAITETHNDKTQSVPIWNGSTRCKPGLDSPVIWEQDMVSINTWHCPSYRKCGVTEPESGTFDAFLERIFRHEVDRRVFKDWLSWCLQNEADKPAWAPFLYSRRKGTGKSTLCRLVSLLFGEANSITQNSISKLTGRFNKPLLDSKLVISEELHLKPESSQGNTLKTYISERVTTSEVKGREVEKVEQYCCFLFTTNHLPLWIEADERRYYVIDVDHDGHASGPRSEEFGSFVAELNAWMEDQSNIARLHAALMRHRQSNGFNPRALNLSTIETPVMQQIIGASKEVLLARLEEWIQGQNAFAIPQERLAKVFVEHLKTNQNRIRHMMPELGWFCDNAKWGGVDHGRAIWVHRDYQVSGGRVRGPNGYEVAVETDELAPIEIIGADARGADDGDY